MASLQKHKASGRASAKKERLEARITPDQKDLFTRAAAINGLTLTSFVIASAQEKAVTTVRDYEAITLSDNDRKVFVDALLNPPEPSEALRDAARLHKQRVAK